MKIRKSLEECYKRLLDRYGPQHWWPADTTFEVMIGAILTQNTNWKNVEKAITNLKAEGLMDPQALYDCPPKKIATLIKPAGYYNIKTKRLKEFLNWLKVRYNLEPKLLKRVTLSHLRSELLSVKGIGPETADSMLLYALNKTTFVIDTYTYRVLSRHSMAPEEASYEYLQDIFMQNLEHNTQMFNEFHALFVRVGKDFCQPERKCKDCPLNGWLSFPPPEENKSQS